MLPIRVFENFDEVPSGSQVMTDHRCSCDVDRSYLTVLAIVAYVALTPARGACHLAEFELRKRNGRELESQSRRLARGEALSEGGK